MTAVLVELCAGSAAVSLRWLNGRASPPFAYQGGKRGYADAILGAMGLQPGGGRGAEIVLVEPGPWGEAWDLWRTPAGRADTIERLRAWAEEDPRVLWERLRSAPVPADSAERVAVWVALQFFGFALKPVLPVGERWDHHGFIGVPAYRAEVTAQKRANGIRYKSGRNQRLPDIIAALHALPDLSHLTVFRCDAAEVPPLPSAIVYLDPPYEGTTCAYGHEMSRATVLDLASRWLAAGAAQVCVSEAEPLPLPGWHHHELGGPVGFGRTWSKQRREVLTMSRPPTRQQELICTRAGR